MSKYVYIYISAMDFPHVESPIPKEWKNALNYLMTAGVLLVLFYLFFCQMSFLKSCLEMFLGQHGTEAWEEHLQAIDLESIALVRPPFLWTVHSFCPGGSQGVSCFTYGPPMVKAKQKHKRNLGKNLGLRRTHQLTWLLQDGAPQF
jgi:hypothetical protein